MEQSPLITVIFKKLKSQYYKPVPMLSSTDRNVIPLFTAVVPALRTVPGISGGKDL